MSETMDWDLVRSVSRSFYLSLKFLPNEVRDTVALTYLLARASDTLADIPAASVNFRLKALQEYTQGRWEEVWESEFNGAKLKAGERLLLASIPILLERIQNHPDGDIIRETLDEIISGQILDIERFSLEGRKALSPEELEDYTYRVAGCVGRFWTRICFRKISNVARLSEAAMIKLGIEYGKGLQLVNILRDRNEDVSQGREYFAQDSFEKVMARAQEALSAGKEYGSALRGVRIRFCSLLPYELGIRTLKLLPAQGRERVRLPRSCVYLTMFRCLVSAIAGR
ncbi:MAG: squalene/phytoene synthase family protein [Chthoniobacterales bacterium]